MRMLGDREGRSLAGNGNSKKEAFEREALPHLNALYNMALYMARDAQDAEDLVGTAVFLASEDSDFITGQVISVDGGAWLR